MTRWTRLGVALGVGFGTTALGATGPGEQLRGLLAPDQRTQVLVLGTAHLASEDGFEPGMLGSVLEQIERFAPDVVCVEALPGDQVAWMLGDEAFAPVTAQFASVHVRLAEAAGVEDRREARDRAWALVGRLERGETLTADERAQTITMLAAAYEPFSAALVWRRMRHDAAVAAALAPELREGLDELLAGADERVSIGVEIAARRGLWRVVGIDDHMDKDALLAIMADLGAQLAGHEAVAAAMGAEIYARAAEVRDRCVERGDLGEHIALLNSEAYARADVDAQWGVFLRTRLASGLDRTRLALWEVRNLNIASHVRRASATHRHVLVVIGAGHKPFLDDLLAGMSDLSVVSYGAIGAE